MFKNVPLAVINIHIRSKTLLFPFISYCYTKDWILLNNQTKSCMHIFVLAPVPLPVCSKEGMFKGSKSSFFKAFMNHLHRFVQGVPISRFYDRISGLVSRRDGKRFINKSS